MERKYIKNECYKPIFQKDTIIFFVYKPFFLQHLSAQDQKAIQTNKSEIIKAQKEWANRIINVGEVYLKNPRTADKKFIANLVVMKWIIYLYCHKHFVPSQ